MERHIYLVGATPPSSGPVSILSQICGWRDIFYSSIRLVLIIRACVGCARVKDNTHLNPTYINSLSPQVNYGIHLEPG